MNETFTLAELETLHNALALKIQLAQPEPDRELLNLQGKVTRMIAQALKEKDSGPVAS